MPSRAHSQWWDPPFCRRQHAGNIIPITIAGLPNNDVKPDYEAEMAFPDALCSALKMPLAIDYRRFDSGRTSSTAVTTPDPVTEGYLELLHTA
jgi:hypothetical protein